MKLFNYTIIPQFPYAFFKIFLYNVLLFNVFYVLSNKKKRFLKLTGNQGEHRYLAPLVRFLCTPSIHDCPLKHI